MGDSSVTRTKKRTEKKQRRKHLTAKDKHPFIIKKLKKLCPVLDRVSEAGGQGRSQKDFCSRDQARHCTRCPIEGARRYAAARSGEDQKFTKHPAGWLRDGCWQDEPSADGVTIDNATGQVIARRKPQHRTWDDVIAMFKEDRE